MALSSLTSNGWPNRSLGPDTDLARRALDVDEAIVARDQRSTAALASERAAITAIAAPIRSRSDAIGVLFAGFAVPPRCEVEDLRWLADSYARTAALCMTGEELPDLLGSSALDSLTGCLNLPGIMDVLSAEVQRSRRLGRELSCLFLDLDGFKLVNEEQGPAAGDRVLAAVGAALTVGARAYDSVGRFGGDEFVVVLPETRVRGARVAANRLRASVRSAIAAVTTVPVDVSIGVAQWAPQSSGVDLLETAHRALREVKRQGGARVTEIPVADRLDGSSELSGSLFGQDGPRPGMPKLRWHRPSGDANGGGDGQL